MELVRDGASARRLVDYISQLRARFAELGVVPYGLDATWTGFRYLATTQHSCGGVRGSDGPTDEYTAVELAHGRHKDHGPMLMVETGRRKGPGDVRSRHSWSVDHVMNDPGRSVQLRVDQRPVAAEYWQQEHLQLATFRREGLDVTVRAREWDDLPGTALTRIVDAESYLNGREILLYRRRR